MKAKIERKDQYAIVKLEEDKLNSLVAPELKTEFVTLNSDDVKNIVIDLSDVAFADSSGLSALLIANRLCKNAGGNLVIVNPQASVSKLIKISQLDTILKLASDMKEAENLLNVTEVQK